jgi:hypothetical protein
MFLALQFESDPDPKRFYIFYAGLFLVLVGATNCGPDSMIAGSITMEVNLIIFSFLNQ